MFKIGCGEVKMDIPLFVELYGYGMYAERRNIGVMEDLYCRAFCFNDGEKRAMIIYTDTCSTNDAYAREMRAKIASQYAIRPDCITFVATHTHNAPALFHKGFLGMGIPDPDFQVYWKECVMKAAAEAFYSEEEIAYAEAGKAPVSQKLGRNRVEVETNITDETIRWAKFIRPDGSCKVLLHSHGIHGICTNGSSGRYATSDWPGAVNREIKDEKLADMPLFLLGPCGDINSEFSTMKNPELESAAAHTAKLYIADLKKSLAAGGEKITDLTIRSAMEPVRMPVRKQSIEELKADSAFLRSINQYEAARANRMDEMIMRIEKGDDLTTVHDLQVLRIGSLSFFFIPGEYFVEDGASLMARSESDHAFAATVSNGNGTYFPSEKLMKRFPNVQSYDPERPGFGYYEIHCYPTGHRYRYADDIAAFVANTLLEIEKKVK